MPDAPDFFPTAAAEPDRAMVLNEELVENVQVLVEDGLQGMVLNLVADLHPADLARLMVHLPVESAQRLFTWIPEALQSAVLPELETAQRTEILEALSAGEIVTLLDRLDTDDAADVLADVEDEVAGTVLPQLEDAQDVVTLLSFPEDTAGGLMGTEYVAVSEEATVADATEEVRRYAEVVDPVYVVYVTGAAGTLTGLVPLKRLLLSPASAPVRSVAETDFISVAPDLDQEEVARIMDRYDLIALPVVTSDKRLLGRITIDDVVDVIREEAEEDFQRASGLSGEEEYTASVFAVSRGRLPWLVIGMTGAFLSGLVIKTFEGALEQAIVLATFIPLVTATGGNAAIQSAAIAVQGLNANDLWLTDGVRRLGKELSVALLNGIALGLVLGIVVVSFGLGDPARLAATVAITLVFVVALATTNGALVPFLLKRLGMDPATSMGPFVTTLNDILGLTVYFIVASLVYL